MIEIEEVLIDQLTEAIYHMLKGDQIEPLKLPAAYPNNELSQLYGYFNQWIKEYDELSNFMYALSRGELDYMPPKGKMIILQSFKSVHASLKHLTWVTEQVAAGDFNHQVNFLGKFSDRFNEMTLQLKNAFEEIRNQNSALEKANELILKEREKSDELLHNILPDKVIHELETTGRTTPRYFENVAIFFSDIVGFTDKSGQIDPVMLIDELNSMFTAFDQIVLDTSGERIKTIGDAFLAVWGMNNPIEQPVHKAVEAAERIVTFLKKRNDSWVLKWEIRIGIHVGNLVGGVVGESKFIYDIFGDAVNMASRMESNSLPMRINISQDVYELIKDDFATTARGTLPVKGKGDCQMYFVETI